MATTDIIGELLRRATSTPPDLLAAEVATVLAGHGASRVTLYVVDYGQSELRPIDLSTGVLGKPADPVPIQGTMPGRAFETHEVLLSERHPFLVWTPVTERAERTGVLEVEFDGPVDDELLTICREVGGVTGMLLATSRRYSDVVPLHRRRRHMTMSAELQWDVLVPPLAFRTGDFSIAGLLEPAYEVAGDAFDYALNGDMLDFAILDAMGHNMSSTMASMLALGAFRYARRQGRGLAEAAAEIDQVVCEQWQGEVFVTGHLARLDTGSGILQMINAGHPSPLLIRAGRVVGELAAQPALPFGLELKVSEIGSWQLEPGDLVFFYSDGLLEARPAGGEQFGLSRVQSGLEGLLGSGRSAAEVLRRLVRQVIDHRATDLADDVTVAFLQWRPPGP